MMAVRATLGGAEDAPQWAHSDTRGHWFGASRLLKSSFATGARAAPPPPPARNSIAAQMAGPWRHLPKPVSDQQFKQDKAYCAMQSNMVPGDEVIKSDLVFLDCLKSKGYEPILSAR
jgi:hypothetical protein